MNCPLCGKPISMFSKQKIADSVICSKCSQVSTPLSANALIVKTASLATMQSYHQYCSRYAALTQNYKYTKLIKKYISIDDNNKLWRLETDKKVKSDIFAYSEILSYELVEDGVSTNRIDLGGALAGGFLFGGLGAIVGGLGKQKKVVDSMSIRITVSNPFVSLVEIKLFENMSLKTTSALFKDYAKSAEQILSLLETIFSSSKAEAAASATPTAPMPVPVPSSSVADEIQKLKGLLDSGAIDEDEFKELKQKLLSQ